MGSRLPKKSSNHLSPSAEFQRRNSADGEAKPRGSGGSEVQVPLRLICRPILGSKGGSSSDGDSPSPWTSHGGSNRLPMLRVKPYFLGKYTLSSGQGSIRKFSSELIHPPSLRCNPLLAFIFIAVFP